MIIFHAIHSVYSHYQDLLEKKTKWLFALEYDATSIHFVNLFLKDNQFVYFNADGFLEKMGLPLPEDAQLLTLITDYSARYYINRLEITQGNFKLIAKLRRSIEDQRRTQSEEPYFRYYTGPLQRTSLAAGFSKSATEMISTSIAKQKPEPPKSTPHQNRENYSSQFGLTADKCIPSSKIRVSAWSPAEFAKSVRLLYEFYGESSADCFTRRKLFKHANLNRFTAAVNENNGSDILRVFNTFLLVNKFIKQNNNTLKSITVTREPFPTENLELETLFRQFKVGYYCTRSPSDRSVADFQQHHAKPAAASTVGKASINFLITESDVEERHPSLNYNFV